MNAIDKVSDKRNHISKPKRIAMYVIYDKDGILDGYRKYYLQELRKVTDKIVAVVSGTLTPESRDELEKLVEDVLVRENVGLLAGSWIDGIKYISWNELYKYDELLMLNDSFFGPFYPLDELFNAAEKSDADFFGAFQNFEAKEYMEMAGRKLRHGHFRGSIGYFYIIKKRLLLSPEFRQYWSSLPEIREDWDTYFFSEIDFFEYVKDAGFKIDSYQSEKYKNYLFNNLTHNMEKLISDEKIPFARMRAFTNDLLYENLSVGYGKDPRKTMEYIEKHTTYDTTMMWDYMLRTKNMYVLKNQLQLEYVVSCDCVEQEYNYQENIAVILHIYYEDQVSILLQYCKNFPEKTDFYITTTNKVTKKKIDELFSENNFHYVCKIRPNIGMAMSTLWVTYADIIDSGKYEYICYVHDKKSPYSDYEIIGQQFAERCFENLMGSKEIVKNIINIFESNPKLGILGPPEPYHGSYYTVLVDSWMANYENTVELAKELGLYVDIRADIPPAAPLGDMFWFRAVALKKICEISYGYGDFNVKYAPDGTKLHALERIYGFIAQNAGYYYAEVINSDEARSDLVNYRYMLHSIMYNMSIAGQIPYSFEIAKNIALNCNDSKRLKKLVLKHKLKKIIPSFIWGKMKFVYHYFGGKKWIG